MLSGRTPASPVFHVQWGSGGGGGTYSEIDSLYWPLQK